MNFDEFEEMVTKQGGHVASFRHWHVYVDIKQYYLGRVFVWAKRADALDYFALSDGEHCEFRSIATLYKKIMDSAVLGSAPDMINLAFLGNEVTHAHAHLVPRYRQPPRPRFCEQAERRQWHDEQWGHNFSHERARGKLNMDDSDDRSLYLAIANELRKAFELNRAELE
jgi:diadenosine tetraphosphate (Ap4A) HIT family hydrolase